MKKIIYQIAVILFVTLWFTACTEEQFTTFNGEKSGIYMANVQSTNISGAVLSYIDSITFSFASSKSDVTQLKRQISVRVMGNPVNYDRPFVFKVDETKSTAKRGINFDFNDEDCVIPANTVLKNIPVIIYRTPDLASLTLRVEFKLEPNEHFTTELERYKNTVAWNATGTTMCGTRFKISFNEFYSEPSWWGMMGGEMFGSWSISKEKRVNAIMGWTHVDWENWNVPYGRMPFAAKQLQKQLQALADEGHPVIDDNGKYMQLASAYAVDYSAYEE